MGGATSEISPATTRVLLEAAYFAPMAIARTSKRLNLRTEASARFERGCDPAGIDRAAAALLRAAGPDRRIRADAGRRRARRAWATCPSPLELAVRPARVNGLLGTALTAADIAGLLGPLGHRGAADRRRRRPGRGDRPDLPTRHPPSPHGRGRPGRGGGPHLRLRPTAAPAPRLAPARAAHPLPAGAAADQGRAVRARAPPRPGRRRS